MKKFAGLSFQLLVVAALFALCALPAAAQLNQSGGPGSSVSITQGGNTATVDAGGALKTNIGEIAGNTVLTGNGVTGTGSLRVTIASDNTAFTVNAAESGTWTVQPGNTANTTAWFVKSVPATTCGTTAVTQALAAVPTSSTAVFSSTTCLIAVYFNNTNASSQTVTLTDNQGTPVNGVGPAFVVPGLSNMTVPLYGVPFTTGVKWSAGGTGVTGGMIGFQ